MLFREYVFCVSNVVFLLQSFAFLVADVGNVGAWRQHPYSHFALRQADVGGTQRIFFERRLWVAKRLLLIEIYVLGRQTARL